MAPGGLGRPAMTGRATFGRCARCRSGQPDTSSALQRLRRKNVCVTERSRGNPIVIIGSGVVGGNAAATLREEGFSGPVLLICREPGVPFGRPPLSKSYLRSEEDLVAWYVRTA